MEAGFHPLPRAALPSLLARYPSKKAERKTDGWIGEPDRSPPTRTMTIFQRRISKSTNNEITLDWTAIEKEKKREILKALIQLHLLRSFNFLKIDRITLASTIWSQVYRSSFIVAMSSDPFLRPFLEHRRHSSAFRYSFASRERFVVDCAP